MPKKKKTEIPSELNELSSLAKGSPSLFVERINGMSGLCRGPFVRRRGEIIRVSRDGTCSQTCSQENADRFFGKPVLDIGMGYYYRSGGQTIAYLDADGGLWRAKISVFVDINYRNQSMRRFSVGLGDWESASSPIVIPTVPIFPMEAAWGALNPYTEKWAVQNGYDPLNLIAAPELEQLAKCGYAFAKDVLSGNRRALGSEVDETKETYLRRLVKHGSSPAEIFKMPVAACKALKDEENLAKWDCIRRMVKSGKMTVEQVKDAARNGWRKDQLEKINSILGCRYDEEPLFSYDTLVRYLERVDVNEAIETDEALILLKDYFESCKITGQEPLLDRYSLKREHDVAARAAREVAAKQTDDRMERACAPLSRFDYEEGGCEYFARAIRGYSDLFDEANQQRNCLMCYTDRIVKGQSLIMVVRRKDAPDKSLVSAELDPDTGAVRQALLRFNERITDENLLSFIERLSQNAARIIREGAASAAA